jgi:hypothetical protein
MNDVKIEVRLRFCYAHRPQIPTLRTAQVRFLWHRLGQEPRLPSRILETDVPPGQSLERTQ